jgi:hypothetical protein
MIDLTGINFSAVIVAAIVYYIIGFLWYTKLFAEIWRSETGSPPDPKPGPVALIGQLGSTLLYALGIAIVMKLSGLPDAGGGVFAGVFVAICFAVPINSGNLFFTGKRKLFLLDVSERLIGSIVVGMILGLWR